MSGLRHRHGLQILLRLFPPALALHDRCRNLRLGNRPQGPPRLRILWLLCKKGRREHLKHLQALPERYMLRPQSECRCHRHPVSHPVGLLELHAQRLRLSEVLCEQSHLEPPRVRLLILLEALRPQRQNLSGLLCLRLLCHQWLQRRVGSLCLRGLQLSKQNHSMGAAGSAAASCCLRTAYCVTAVS